MINRGLFYTIFLFLFTTNMVIIQGSEEEIVQNKSVSESEIGSQVNVLAEDDQLDNFPLFVTRTSDQSLDYYQNNLDSDYEHEWDEDYLQNQSITVQKILPGDKNKRKEQKDVVAPEDERNSRRTLAIICAMGIVIGVVVLNKVISKNLKLFTKDTEKATSAKKVG